MAGVVNYTPDDNSIFPNPERGFTDELGGELALSNTKNHVIKPSESWYFNANNAERRNQRLVMLMYYLKNFKTQDISDAVLQGFDEDMQILRNHGYKCVLRFAYDWQSKNDAVKDWVLRHITQLKPHLAANADVIYVLETGFVGEWGEWYYSANFGNESQHLNADRRAVLDAMIDACPADRFLLVRYPLIKIEYLGDENPLTSGEAFSGAVRARIGHHNDAFLNAWGNDGTYGRDGNGPDDDPVLRRYIATETLYTPNGGETNVESSSLANIVSQHDTTIAELGRYHWSFCGAEYSEAVTNKWRTNGTFAEMQKRLGYRFQLVNAALPDTAAPGGLFPFRIQIVNKGFAPLYNARTVYIVLKNNTDRYLVPLQTDPRRWTAEAGTITISEMPVLENTIAEGTYQLYLYMPDKYASLADDPRYAIRFANENVWDENTGMNDLGARVEIVAGYQGIEQVPSEQVPSDQVLSTKVLIDGALYILRGDKKYTMLGAALDQNDK